jgi:hypothetical protein
VLLIRLAPLLGLGICAAVIGFNLADLIPPGGRIYLVIVLLALLLSLVILDTEPGWNLILFLSFAGAAGALLFWSGAAFTRWNTWVLFLSLIVISILGGTFLGARFGRAGRFLFPITILYLIGWTLFLFYQLPAALKMIWIISGLILFTLINISLLIRGKTQNQEGSPVPLAIGLFVVLFNLCWLSGLI